MMKIKSKLFLKSFFLSFAAFAAVAVIIITNAYMNKMAVDPQNKESVILLGVSDGYSIISLALVDIDPISKTISFCNVEDNTVISNGVLLQNMYSEKSVSEMISTLSKIVGVRIDRYALLSPSAVGELTDCLDGVNYLIPYKFEFDGKSYSGNSVMSGEVVSAMLSYGGYSKEVSVSDMACSYLRSYAVRYSELSSRIDEIHDVLHRLSTENSIDTNLTDSEMREYCEIFADYSSFAHKNVSIAGSKQETSSNVFFIPSTLHSPSNIFK